MATAPGPVYHRGVIRLLSLPLLLTLAAAAAAFQALPDTLLPPTRVRLGGGPEATQALASRGDLLASLRQADALVGAGDYGAAAAGYRDVGATLERELGARHPVVRDVLRAMAGALLLTGDHRRAGDLAEKALLREQQADPPAPPRRIEAEALLVDVALAQGQGTQALAHASREVELTLRHFGRSHLVTSFAMADLAMGQLLYKDYQGAANTIRHAKILQDIHIGEDRADRARMFFVLARVSMLEARPVMARRHLESALRSLEAVGGRDHPRLLSVLRELATLLEGLGDLEAAVGYARRALGIARRFLSGGRPEAARLTDQLALIEIRREDFAAARGYLEQGRTLRAAAQAGQPDLLPGLAESLEMSAVIDAVMTFELGDAEAALEKALLGATALTASRGHACPALPLAWAVAAQAYLRLGDSRRAVSYARRALTRGERLVGDKSPLVASYQVDLVAALRQRGELREATEMAEIVSGRLGRRDAARAEGTRHAPPNPTRAEIHALAARLMGDAGDLAEAAEQAATAVELAKGAGASRRTLLGHATLEAQRSALDRGQTQEARRWQDAARPLLEGRPALDPLVLDAALLGARLRTQAGEFRAADEAFEALARTLVTAYGSGHPRLAEVWRFQAEARTLAAGLPEAEGLLRRSVDLAREVLVPGSPAEIWGLLELADNLVARELPDKARPLLEHALPDARLALGAKHPLVRRLEAALAKLP